MIFARLKDFFFDRRFFWWWWQNENKAGFLQPQKKVFVSLTFDVEQDSGSFGENKVVKTNLFLERIIKHLAGKPATFFLQGNIIGKINKNIQKLPGNIEFGVHSWSHDRLWGKPVWFLKDKPLDQKEKEKQIDLALKAFKKYKLPKPKTFRACNLIIDKKTLQVLKMRGFLTDSSWPVFRSSSEIKKICGLLELPISSLANPKINWRYCLPFKNYLVFNMANLKKIEKKDLDNYLINSNCLVFLGHSWDFNQEVFTKFFDFLENTFQVEYLSLSNLAKKIKKT